jgi:predicted nucleic acid-binding protein
MTAKPRPLAFLDANVLYPALLRNILMRLARRDLFRAFWSDRVHDEWTGSLLRDRPDLPRAAIERTRRLMDENIDDAKVTGYESLIDGITLPDADDRHVLAAAIHCGASVIVTANLGDFPADTLAFHGIEAQHPDAFILGLFDTATEQVVDVIRELRDDLRNPPLTAAQLLAAMSRNSLSATAQAVTSFTASL